MNEWPKISIITPSYNQCDFLEEMILSVLDQRYPNLEFIIIDGGSTDGSVDTIRKYEKQLAYWVSEPDKGQSDAINKGLRQATGEWLAWQNSDDVYMQGSFESLRSAAIQNPDAKLIIGDMLLIDGESKPIRDIRYVRPTHNSLIAEGMVLTNQSSFWHRSIHDNVGYLAEDLHYAFDYEWFLRITKDITTFHVPEIWGALRLHDETKTSLHSEKFLVENQEILQGRQMSEKRKALYKLRRFLLMLKNGQVHYLARGMLRRTIGKSE